MSLFDNHDSKHHDDATEWCLGSFIQAIAVNLTVDQEQICMLTGETNFPQDAHMRGAPKIN